MLGWKSGVHMVEHDFPCETDDFVLGTMDNYFIFGLIHAVCFFFTRKVKALRTLLWFYSLLYPWVSEGRNTDSIRGDREPICRRPGQTTAMNRSMAGRTTFRPQHVAFWRRQVGVFFNSTIFGEEFHQIKATRTGEPRSESWDSMTLQLDSWISTTDKYHISMHCDKQRYKDRWIRNPPKTPMAHLAMPFVWLQWQRLLHQTQRSGVSGASNGAHMCPSNGQEMSQCAADVLQNVEDTFRGVDLPKTFPSPRKVQHVVHHLNPMDL